MIDPKYCDYKTQDKINKDIVGALSEINRAIHYILEFQGVVAHKIGLVTPPMKGVNDNAEK